MERIPFLFSKERKVVGATFRSCYGISTYDLVNARDLGLENSDGISDRWLLGVGNG